MRKMFPALILVFALLAPTMIFAQGEQALQLPAVSGLSGTDCFEAIRQRESIRAYSGRELALQDLGDVLWAANGLKAPGGKWIVPFARRTDPTLRIYLTGKNGTFLYDGSAHSLNYVNGLDLRSEVAMQDFVAEAPVVLLFVVDPSPLYNQTTDRPLAEVLNVVYLSCGASMQNVYLAACAKGMGTCFIGSIKRGEWEKELAPGEAEACFGVMPLGYPPE